MTDRPANSATKRGLLAALGFGRQAAAGPEGNRDLLRLQAALARSLDAFCSLVPLPDAQGNVTDFQIAFCNPAFAQLWRSSGNAQAGARLSAVLPSALARTLVPQYVQVLLTGESLLEDRERLTPDGAEWLRHHVVAAADGVAVTLRDITLQQQAEQRLKQITPYDLVTGLPNLLTFNDRLDHALLRAKRVQRSFGLMAVDLADVGRVVEAHGEVVGNQVLQLVAVRMRRALRDSDTLGRVAPYRFMVVLEDERDLAGTDVVARTLMKVAVAPIDLDGLPVQLTASIGATLWSDERQTAGDLIAQADAAQRLARRSGPNQHACWSPELAGRPAR
jgi:diguanylate cyclase (GGDEF)-like protein